jgi:hypothetical protein
MGIKVGGSFRLVVTAQAEMPADTGTFRMKVADIDSERLVSEAKVAENHARQAQAATNLIVFIVLNLK